MSEKILRVVTVLFKKKPDGAASFLLLHRCLNWRGWELLKGQIEQNESLEEAVKREVFEETGLKNIRIIKKVEQKMTFFDRIRKKESEVFGFLVESLENTPVSFENNPVQEHDGFEWVGPDVVLQKLRFDNMRQFFEKALTELKEVL